jgi:4-aminobutyrate aminotransferase-like enzyme
LENVSHMGEVLNMALHERFGEHPFVGDIRGRGLFRALELVAEALGIPPQSIEQSPETH